MVCDISSVCELCQLINVDIVTCLYNSHCSNYQFVWLLEIWPLLQNTIYLCAHVNKSELISLSQQA